MWPLIAKSAWLFGAFGLFGALKLRPTIGR